MYLKLISEEVSFIALRVAGLKLCFWRRGISHYSHRMELMTVKIVMILELRRDSIYLCHWSFLQAPSNSFFTL